MNLSFRFSTTHFVKTITRFMAIFYFAILFYIFFLARRRRGPALPWRKRHLNLIPLKNKLAYFISQFNVPDPQLREFYIDFFGNILLFIPFVFVLYFFLHVKDTRKIMIISVLTSVTIEIMQFILSIGVADIDDVILNTAGAAIGSLILRLLTKVIFARKTAQFR
jgi:glycopeptide antibiotics resistance protein